MQHDPLHVAQLQGQQNYLPQPWQTSRPQMAAPRPGFAHRAIAGLSICGVILGVIAILLGIVSIVLETATAFIGTGIWCGVFFIITGSFGLVSAKKKTNAFIITFMVLSIISSVFAFVLVSISSTAIPGEYNCYYDYRYEYEYTYGCSDYGGRVALDALLVTLGVAEGVISIITSALCCRVVCCGQPQMAMYYAAPMQGLPVQGNYAAGQGLQMISDTSTLPPYHIRCAPQPPGQRDQYLYTGSPPCAFAPAVMPQVPRLTTGNTPTQGYPVVIAPQCHSQQMLPMQHGQQPLQQELTRPLEHVSHQQTTHGVSPPPPKDNIDETMTSHLIENEVHE